MTNAVVASDLAIAIAFNAVSCFAAAVVVAVTAVIDRSYNLQMISFSEKRIKTHL